MNIVKWLVSQMVDLKKPSVDVSRSNLLLTQGDNGAHAWRIEVVDNMTKVDLQGCTAIAYFVRADNVTCFSTGTIQGNVITAVLPSAVYSVVGTASGFMRLTSTDGTITTLSLMRCTVKKSLTDELVDNDEVLPSIDELLSKISVMEGLIGDGQDVIERAQAAIDEAEQLQANFSSKRNRFDLHVMPIGSTNASGDTPCIAIKQEISALSAALSNQNQAYDLIIFLGSQPVKTISSVKLQNGSIKAYLPIAYVATTKVLQDSYFTFTQEEYTNNAYLLAYWHTDQIILQADEETLNAKQDKLVSGTNIKTINNESVLGSGNITVGTGGGRIMQDPTDENKGIVSTGTLASIDPTLKLSGYAADAKKTGEAIDSLQSDITGKQDTISDLSTIRSGAAAGAAALPNTQTAINTAVTAALTDSNHLTMTSAQQDTACAVVGAERAKGEWVLKGTWTDVNGVTVDLTGCTELIIKGRIKATASTQIRINDIYFSEGVTNSDRMLYIYCMNNMSAMIPVIARYRTLSSGTIAYINGPLNPNIMLDMNVQSVTNFSFSNPANVTLTDAKIYAR